MVACVRPLPPATEVVTDMKGRPEKLYSVWANDEHDTLIALDLPAKECAERMGISLTAFYTYISRPKKMWTIEVRKAKE